MVDAAKDGTGSGFVGRRPGFVKGGTGAGSQNLGAGNGFCDASTGTVAVGICTGFEKDGIGAGPPFIGWVPIFP